MTNTKTRTHSTKRKTVQVAGWVLPQKKARIQAIAKQQGISESKVVGGLIDKALQTDADLQYGAMLTPVIQSAIHKEMQALTNRLTFFSVRNTFDSGQIRGLVINILGRMPGITPELVNEIVDDAAKGAKRRIVSRTPQFDAFLTELKKWFDEKEKKQN